MPSLFDIPSPPSLLVAHRPAEVLGKAQRIATTPDSMKAWFGDKAFYYQEDIVFPQDVTRIDSRDEAEGGWHEKILHRLNHPLNDTLVVSHIDERVGYGLFTTHPIELGTIIGIYAGQLPNALGGVLIPAEAKALLTDNAFARLKSGDYKLGWNDVNAGLVGGLSRFIQHMPLHKKALLDRIDAALNHQQIVEIMQVYAAYPKNAQEVELGRLKFLAKQQLEQQFLPHFIDSSTEALLNEPKGADVASANLIAKDYTFNGVSFKVLMANRCIQAGEQLGFDYELTFWKERGIRPSFFHQATGLVFDPRLQEANTATVFFSVGAQATAVQCYQAGVDCYKLKKFDQAIDYLNQALPLFQGNALKEATCLSALASCYRDLNQLSEAIARCQLAHEKQPDHAGIQKKWRELQALMAINTEMDRPLKTEATRKL